MPPKEAPKKGIFKIVKIKIRDRRGGDDAGAFWEFLMSTEEQFYEDILQQYQAAAEDEQEAARNLLNELQDGFGDMFYDQRSMADMAWSEGDEGNKKAIMEFFEQNVFPQE